MRRVLVFFILLLLDHTLVSAYKHQQQTPDGHIVVVDQQYSSCAVDGDCGNNAVCHAFPRPYEAMLRYWIEPGYDWTGSTAPTCSCNSETDCPYATKCLSNPEMYIGYTQQDGAMKCMCQQDSDCGIGWVCVTELCDFFSGEESGCLQKGLGVCMCDLRVQPAFSSCGGEGRGVCTEINVPTDPFAYYRAKTASGDMVTTGQCACNTADGWTGAKCEVDTAKIDRCNNHGEAICDGSSTTNPNTIFSTNTGNNIGERCLYNTDAARAANYNLDRGGPSLSSARCNCDSGYYPDVSSGVGSCVQALPCGVSGITDPTSGHCKCTGNSYRVDDVCVGGCDADVCNGNGRCVGNNFNDDCICDPGWQTDPVLATFLGFAKYSRCSVPVETFDGVEHPCGYYGVYDSGSRACRCQSFGDASYAVAGSQTTVSLKPCLSRCLTWTAPDSNSITQETPNNQMCGGVHRGQCVADAHGGSRCTCKDGYKGSSCAVQMCPTRNGAICAGNGKCDPSTGGCICKEGFVGLSCEIRVLDCAAAQVVKSYPPASMYTFV
jgi:hypothetical protein